MTHGIMKKVIRGIPPFVAYEALKLKKAQIDTRGA